jgi:glycosidase
MAGYYPFPTWGWALDGTNPGLIEYYSKLARYYVEHFHTDGWRVDSPMNNYDPAKVSGDHSRVVLIRSVRAAITAAKSGAVLLAEITGPEVAWNADDSKAKPLFDEMCEVSYNYDSCGFLGGMKKSGCAYVMFNGAPGVTPFHPTILGKVVNNQATSKEFVDSITHQRILYDRLRANFIENHDTARVSECFSDQHRALFALIATMPGVPVVHSGQEIGSTVHPDASGNTNVIVDWTKSDSGLEEYYERVMNIRKNNKALVSGDIQDIWKSGDKTIAFMRKSGDSLALVLLNFSTKPASFTVALPLSDLGLLRERSYQLRDELGAKTMAREGKALENLDMHLERYGEQIVTITSQ